MARGRPPLKRTDRIAKLVEKGRKAVDAKKRFGKARRLALLYWDQHEKYRPEATANLIEATVMAITGEVSEKELLNLSEQDGQQIARFGVKLLAQGKKAEAEGAGKLATMAAPRVFEAWVLLACASAQLGKDSQAVIAYEQAAALQPKHVRTWVDLGELYLRRLDYARAAERLATAMKLDPKGETPAGKRAQVLIVKTLMTLESA